MSEVAGLYQQPGYDFMAAVFDVYDEMGSGCLEEVYYESLELELASRTMPFISKPKLPLFYKGRQFRPLPETWLEAFCALN